MSIFLWRRWYLNLRGQFRSPVTYLTTKRKFLTRKGAYKHGRKMIKNHPAVYSFIVVREGEGA